MTKPSCCERDVREDSRYLTACKACCEEDCEGYVAPNEADESDCLCCGHPADWHGTFCDSWWQQQFEKRGPLKVSSTQPLEKT
jgi:hypothetical protein